MFQNVVVSSDYVCAVAAAGLVLDPVSATPGRRWRLSASALKTDARDGYPRSLRKIAQRIAGKGCNKLVFLSGLYAPLPFANSRLEDLVTHVTCHFRKNGRKYCCRITAKFREDIRGFGILHVHRNASRTMEFR